MKIPTHTSRYAAGALTRAAAFAFMALVALTACRKTKVDPREEKARDLYMRSISLMKAYTDSMRHVSDSAAWERLTKDYDERLAKLNFEYPPDTDHFISEGENDTLYTMTSRYIHARDKAIERITHPVQPADSLPTADDEESAPQKRQTPSGR